MNTSELAIKIAEEVFRTIERERGIVKAEIVDAVEKVLAQDVAKSNATPVPDGWFVDVVGRLRQRKTPEELAHAASLAFPTLFPQGHGALADPVHDVPALEKAAVSGMWSSYLELPPRPGVLPQGGVPDPDQAKQKLNELSGMREGGPCPEA